MSEANSTEVWKPVVGHEGYYEVSNMGRVRSMTISVRGSHGSTRLRRGTILIPNRSGDYPIVRLCKDAKKRTVRIHRLVLEAFVGPCPKGHWCRHFPDGNRQNNRLDNLQWGTPKANADDREIQGNGQRGEKNKSAKLTEQQAKQILQLCRDGLLAHHAIGKKFGVRQQAVSRIARGERWAHLTQEET
jgi:hypothetical protein